MLNQPTREQIIEAAETSPEAYEALSKLYPDLFDHNELMDLREFDTGDQHNGTQVLRNMNIDDVISSYLAFGLAPKPELEGRAVYLSNNRGREIVIFDVDGNEVHRGERLFIGFTK